MRHIVLELLLHCNRWDRYGDQRIQSPYLVHVPAFALPLPSFSTATARKLTRADGLTMGRARLALEAGACMVRLSIMSLTCDGEKKSTKLWEWVRLYKRSQFLWSETLRLRAKRCWRKVWDLSEISAIICDAIILNPLSWTLSLLTRLRSEMDRSAGSNLPSRFYVAVSHADSKLVSPWDRSLACRI